jgi:hypothetical protein
MKSPSGSRRWLWVSLAGGLVLLGAGVLAACFVGKAGRDTAPGAPEDRAEVALQVHQFCGTACHAYPPPDAFPRRYWRGEVEQGFRFFEKSGLSLQAPPLESVVRYYERRAPEELAQPELQPAGGPLPCRFERRYPGQYDPRPYAISNVNLVRLPEPGKPASPGAAGLDVLACDMSAGLVMLLRPDGPAPAWKVLARHSADEAAPANPAHAEVVDLDGDGIPDILVADLGSFPPTDSRCGRVVWLRGRPDGSFTPVPLLDNVGRVADVQAADFRGTGKLDLVVAEFGWRETGAVLLLENQTTDWDHPKFVPRTLDPRHGTIHVPVADLNGDGRPDFVALISQEHETVVAFLNEGGGRFRKETIYTAPHPAYGSSGIQLVDLDGDGDLDVLYTNGDILDQPYLFKPYHGIQWLENPGPGQFPWVHHPIAPMYGVHRAVAADLFGTGRKDIVAVSFLPDEKFPDRRRRAPDGLIVLEQVAPGKFERHSLETVDCDHVTCAVGDLYGTGRPDLVVGNFSSLATDAPVTVWKNMGPAKHP